VSRRNTISACLALLLIPAAGWLWLQNYRQIRAEGLANEVAYYGTPSPSAWKRADEDVRASAVAVIGGQLDAFGQDDYEKAVTFQSVGLRRSFPTADRFRDAMITYYPQFARCSSIEYGETRCSPDGGRIHVRVKVRGKDGVEVQASYLLIREGDTLRIDGVTGGLPAPPNGGVT
jgi:hypothetical protein